ncbi:MAG: hypothetical protein U5P41_07145 [Gammaproteobacteria bacterium]|nr:hypothetical protein [Gammaproteobacteria bacterium]
MRTVNNWRQKLAAPITTETTTITLDAGREHLGDFVADGPLLLTLSNIAGAIEILRATGHGGSAEQITVERAVEDFDRFPPRAWPAGTIIEARITAGMWQAVQDALDSTA